MKFVATLLLSILFELCSYKVTATLHWSAPEPFPYAGKKEGFVAAPDRQGQLLVVWHTASEGLWYSQYSLIYNSWKEPQLILKCTARSSLSLLGLCLDAQNSPLLFWLDKDANQLCCMPLAPSVSDPVTSPLCYKDSLLIEVPQIASDNEGNCVCVWRSWNGVEHTIRGLFYQADTRSWSPASDLSALGLDCQSPKLVLNEKGHGLLVWQAQLSLRTPLHTFVQSLQIDTKQKSWSHATTRGYDWIDSCFLHPTPLIDQEGNSWLLWERHMRCCPLLSKSRLDRYQITQQPTLQYIHWSIVQGNWSRMTDINLIEYGTYITQLSCSRDPYGRLAAFLCPLAKTSRLTLCQYQLATENWQEIFCIEDKIDSNAPLTLLSDAFSKSTVAWRTQEGILMASHFDPHLEAHWSSPHPISGSHASQAFDLKSDSLGNQVALFLSEETLFYALGSYLLPPTHVTGAKLKKHFPTKVYYVAHLHWRPAQGSQIQGYKLRRNGELIALLPPHICDYKDAPCPPHLPLCYQITTLNKEGRESSPIELVL